MRRGLMKMAVAVGAASLVLAGCVSSSDDAATEPAAEETATEEVVEETAAEETAAAEASGDPLVLGIVQAGSGFMGPIDTPARNALLLEVEKVNAAGGVNGQPITVEFIDTETAFERYAPAAEEVIGKGANVLIVTCDYDVSAPAALVAEGKNILNLAPCIGDPIYGPDGGLPNGFSIGAGTPGETTVMAEFAVDKGWQTAVLLRDMSIKYTQNQCAIFDKRFTELGGQVLATYDYVQGDSVKETVSKIAAGEQPDVIVNCGYNPGGGQVAKEIRDGGVEVPIISGFGMDGDFWVGAIPNLKDYYVVTYAAKNGDDPDSAVNDYAAEYEATYGSPPDVGGFVTGPATLQLILEAYNQAGSWDGDKLTAAFEAMNAVPTLAGPSSFSPDLHINVERPMAVLVVEDGKLKWIEDRAPEKVTFAG
ncbi:MAG: ABC transporter substrate-binding protein [Candidatus Nanopelagicales bacterium]